MPTSTLEPSPPQDPRSGAGRGNAVVALLSAFLTLASLAMPWAAYSGESGDLSWSGTDIARMPTDFSDRMHELTLAIHVMEVAAAVAAIVSLLRLLSRAVRLAWLALLGSAVALCAAIAAVTQLDNLLSNGDPFTPSLQAGAAVSVAAASLGSIAAIRGVVVQRRASRRGRGLPTGGSDRFSAP